MKDVLIPTGPTSSSRPLSPHTGRGRGQGASSAFGDLLQPAFGLSASEPVAAGDGSSPSLPRVLSLRPSLPKTRAPATAKPDEQDGNGTPAPAPAGSVLPAPTPFVAVTLAEGAVAASPQSMEVSVEASQLGGALAPGATWGGLHGARISDALDPGTTKDTEDGRGRTFDPGRSRGSARPAAPSHAATVGMTLSSKHGAQTIDAPAQDRLVLSSNDDASTLPTGSARVSVAAAEVHHAPPSPVAQIVDAMIPALASQNGSTDEQSPPIATAELFPARSGEPVANPAAPSTSEKVRVLVLDLHPKDLGSVHVRMRLVGAELHVGIIAANDTAAVIAGDGRHLADRLAEAGMSLASLHVATTTPGEGASTPDARASGFADRDNRDASSDKTNEGAGRSPARDQRPDTHRDTPRPPRRPAGDLRL